MTIDYTWRGTFTNGEVNGLHAEAFNTRLFSSAEWDWSSLTAKHSLGWVVAREGDGLVGFVNVVADGLVHAWIQDVMVATACRGNGIGAALVAEVRTRCVEAKYEWLHVDFDDELRAFYLDRCGFTPTTGGLMHLS